MTDTGQKEYLLNGVAMESTAQEILEKLENSLAANPRYNNFMTGSFYNNYTQSNPLVITGKGIITFTGRAYAKVCIDDGEYFTPPVDPNVTFFFNSSVKMYGTESSGFPTSYFAQTE